MNRPDPLNVPHLAVDGERGINGRDRLTFHILPPDGNTCHANRAELMTLPSTKVTCQKKTTGRGWMPRCSTLMKPSTSSFRRSIVPADQRFSPRALSNTLDAHQSACKNDQRTREERSGLNTRFTKHYNNLQRKEKQERPEVPTQGTSPLYIAQVEGQLQDQALMRHKKTTVK